MVSLMRVGLRSGGGGGGRGGASILFCFGGVLATIFAPNQKVLKNFVASQVGIKELGGMGDLLLLHLFSSFNSHDLEKTVDQTFEFNSTLRVVE